MGYTLAKGGQVIDSGSLKADEKDKIGPRLWDIGDQLQDILKEHRPVDVCLIEFLRSSTGHVYIVWSAGNAVRDSICPVVIEIPTHLWSKVKDEGWFKCDALDSRYIYELARIICEEDEDAT